MYKQVTIVIIDFKLILVKKTILHIALVKMLLICLLVCVFPVTGNSAESGWNEAGVRIGLQVSSKAEYFRQYEAFAVYGLPWDWRGTSGWGLTPQVNFALGVLTGVDDNGLIASVGTAVVLDKQVSGISTELGINTNLLDKRNLGRMDFGSILQFGACVGVNYRFSNGFKIGYRIQHISNGHIFYQNGTPNHGLDLHMVGISYVF